MGSRTQNSTRARKERHAKRSPLRPRAPEYLRPPNQLRIPAAIEIAIDDQRSSIAAAISLLYCLHSALRREIEDAGRIESPSVEHAAESADLTDISSMLLVRLDSIHSALDPTELVSAKVDPEMVRLTQMSRQRERRDRCVQETCRCPLPIEAWHQRQSRSDRTGVGALGELRFP
jgi:hypothetical protein